MRSIVAVITAASTLGACEGADPCFRDAGIECAVCEAITEPASLEIGGGDEVNGFTELQNGAEMEFVSHPWGYMLQPSIRARGIHPGVAGRSGHFEDPLISVELFLEDMPVGSWLGGEEHAGLYPTDRGDVLYGLFVVFGDIDARSEWENKSVSIRAEITDACSNTATDVLEVVAVCRPDDTCNPFR